MQREPTMTLKFKTVRGLLIADTLLRDVAEREAADRFVAFEELTEREWIIQVYRDEKGKLSAVRLFDSALVKPGDFSGP